MKRNEKKAMKEAWLVHENWMDEYSFTAFTIHEIAKKAFEEGFKMALDWKDRMVGE